MKRLFELILSLIAASLLIIPLALVAILVKLTSKGPALYWSDRVGMYNTIFKMPKFRSMKVDTPAVASHLMNDPDAYITLFGGFLRHTSLDELPQLWCILKGDMSFVGPRPCLPYEWAAYNAWHKTRLEILPGLSGLWQISGRSEVTHDDMVILDIYYKHNLTPWIDLEIILKMNLEMNICLALL